LFNVFIVDDEPLILEGLHAILNWNALDLNIVGEAENGEEALELIAEENLRVDILLTDISMPEMDGLELMRRLKEKNPRLRCIVLSGYNEFIYVKEAIRIGIENYLLKPINREELQQTLVNTVEQLLRDQSDRLLDDEIQHLKDNLWFRWLTRRMTLDEWTSRADLLHMKMPAPHAAVVLIKTVHPSCEDEEIHGSERAALVRREMEDGLNLEGVPSICLINLDDDLIAVCGLPSTGKEMLLRLRETLERQARRLEDVHAIRPLVLIGSVQSGIVQIPDSYQHAQEALSLTLLDPERIVWGYDEKPADVPTVRIAFSPDSEYTRLLAANDLEALLEMIDQDMEACLRIEGVTPSQLRNAALERCHSMIRMLREAQTSLTGDGEDYRDINERIFQAATPKRLADCVKLIARNVAEALNDRSSVSPIIKQILQHIHTHYSEELSLKLLGQLYHTHPVYLGQLFHKETSQTFSDYVNRYRIGKAKELLAESNLKTQSIANKVGFWDSNYFYKQFKKYSGVSPTEYRTML